MALTTRSAWSATARPAAARASATAAPSGSGQSGDQLNVPAWLSKRGAASTGALSSSVAGATKNCRPIVGLESPRPPAATPPVPAWLRDRVLGRPVLRVGAGRCRARPGLRLGDLLQQRQGQGGH